MSDIRLVLSGQDFLGDLVIENNDLAVDDGLETAVIISLFTDARAPDGVELPDGSDDRRGWWGDAVEQDSTEQTGSLLWLLEREKQTTIVVQRAQQYAREALQWMIDDRVAASVDVTAEIVSQGILGLLIEVRRPTGDAVQYRYDYAWQAQSDRQGAA